MRLKYENDSLKVIDKKITSSDSLVYLTTDIDASILGIVKLSNGTKVIEFIKDEDEYKARLIINESDLPYIGSAKLYIELINANMSKTSNIVDLSFDITLIKSDIRRSISNEYKELTKRIIQLEDKIKIINSSSILKDIQLLNKETIKKGMIPIAIDDNGNFAAMYPFSNHITEVNGQKAANGAIILDASMLKYKKNGKSIEKTLDDQAQALVALKNLIDEVIANQREIRQKLDELDIQLSTHINAGII